MSRKRDLIIIERLIKEFGAEMTLGQVFSRLTVRPGRRREWGDLALNDLLFDIRDLQRQGGLSESDACRQWASKRDLQHKAVLKRFAEAKELFTNEQGKEDRISIRQMMRKLTRAGFFDEYFLMNERRKLSSEDRCTSSPKALT